MSSASIAYLGVIVIPVVLLSASYAQVHVLTPLNDTCTYASHFCLLFEAGERVTTRGPIVWVALLGLYQSRVVLVRVVG